MGNALQFEGINPGLETHDASGQFPVLVPQILDSITVLLEAALMLCELLTGQSVDGIESVQEPGEKFADALGADSVQQQLTEDRGTALTRIIDRVPGGCLGQVVATA